MTIVTPSADRRVRIVGVLLAAVVVGVLFGVADLIGQLALPDPWFEIANSMAVWAVSAFLFGRAVGTGIATAAVSGALMLTVAVEAYYLAAALALNDNIGNLTSRSTVIWIVLGVVAGAGFGAAGAVSRRPETLYAAPAAALGASVLFAEGIVLREGWSVLIDVVLGVLVLALSVTGTKRWLLAGAASVPLTAFVVFAFDALGFGVS
ncbi:MAG TPA: DUF6518 family protein [Jatrophihabitans sp.]|jgi:hypothetical protein